MKIIAYDDNPDYGGHQAMSCRGIEALAADPSNEIIFMLNPENRMLVEKLTALDACEVVESPCKTRRPQGIKNLLDRQGIAKLETRFKTMQADLILCIQGDIEQSSQAVLAAQRAGIECVSYIGLPHSMATMGATLGPLRDACNRFLFTVPDRYMAISESMAELLRSHGVRQPIAIVPNGIDTASAGPAKSQTSPFTLGMLGRTEFKQKQQDFMVRAFCAFPEAFSDCNLIMAGGGPDQTELEALVSRCSRCEDIQLIPWQQDHNAFFESIDLLVIPSRYEGVPLAMLEALVRGIPVIGSNRDGMKDILPAEWLFVAENPAGLAETFVKVRNTWRNGIDALQQRIIANHSLEAFSRNFRNAVLDRPS